MIDTEAEAAATADLVVEPAVESEPQEPSSPPVEVEARFSWDHGLSLKERKKKEKEMKLNGAWNDKLTQEKIDEDGTAAVAVESEPEPAPVKEEKSAKKSGFFDSIVEEAVPDLESVLEPASEPALVIEHIWTRAVTRPEEPREPLLAPESVEEVVQHSPCIDRRQHLQDTSRWLACSMCMQEIVAIARSAASI